MFLGTVAKVIDQTPTEDVPQALESALRDFSHAAPKHTTDQEESLFPRHVRSRMPKLRRLNRDLTSWKKKHRRADSFDAETERLGMKYLTAGRLLIEEVVRFETPCESLAS